MQTSVLYQKRPQSIDLNEIFHAYTNSQDKVVTGCLSASQQTLDRGIEILTSAYERYILENRYRKILPAKSLVDDRCPSFGHNEVPIKPITIFAKKNEPQTIESMLLVNSQPSQQQQENNLLLKPLSEQIPAQQMHEIVNDYPELDRLEMQDIAESATKGLKKSLKHLEYKVSEESVTKVSNTSTMPYTNSSNSIHSIHSLLFKDPLLSVPVVASKKFTFDDIDEQQEQQQNKLTSSLFFNPQPLKTHPLTMDFENFKTLKQKKDLPNYSNIVKSGNSNNNFVSTSMDFSVVHTNLAAAPKKNPETKQMYKESSKVKSSIKAKKKPFPSMEQILAHNSAMRPEDIFGSCIALNVGLEYFLLGEDYGF